MAITFLSAGTGAAAAGATDVTPGMPTGARVNDLLILVIEGEGEDANDDPIPTGGAWTLVDSVASATDSLATRTRCTVAWAWYNASLNLTVPSAGDHTVAKIYAFRGVDLTTPVEGFTIGSNATSTTSHSADTGLTSLTDGAMILLAYTHGDNVIAYATDIANAALASVTSGGGESTTHGSDGTVELFYGIDTTAGDTGTFTWTSSVSEETAWVAMSLRPMAETTLLTHTFTGTDTHEWADPPWAAEVTYGGGDSDIHTNRGRQLSTTTNYASVLKRLTTALSTDDIDILVSITLSSVRQQYACITLRGEATTGGGSEGGRFLNSSVNAEVWHASGGSAGRATLSLRNASGTQSGAVTTNITLNAAKYWMRVRAIGSDITLRVWSDGGSEPTAPTVVLTDSTYSGGNFALGFTGDNDSIAEVVYWDDLTVKALGAAPMNATATPAVVAAVAAVAAPSLSTGSSVSPATVAGVAGVPAPTVSVGAVVSPSVVPAVAAVPAPTVSTGVVVSPSVVAAVAAVPAPSINTGATVTPATVAAVARVTTYVYPEDYSAVGDGVANDQTAITNALGALDRMKVLLIRDGKVYNHNAVLTWSTAGTVTKGMSGVGGKFHATVQTASAFKVTGTGQQLGPVEFGSVNTSRGTTLEHQKLVIQGTGTYLWGTRVTSSHAAGLFLFGATNTTADDVEVSGTRADGIHMTYGTTGARINRPSSTSVGDDGVAVVSYGGDPAICNDIIVTDPVVLGSNARGIAVVGGSNIQYLNIDVEDTVAAGLYIATEGGSYNTYAVSNVTVTVDRIALANDSGAIDHGDITLYAGHTTSISGVTITNGDGGAYGHIEDSVGTLASYHIRGFSDTAATVVASISDLQVCPKTAKTLVVQGTNATLTVTNVEFCEPEVVPVAAVASVPTPTIVTTTDALVTPVVVAAVAAVGAPTVVTGSAPQPAVVAAVAAVLDPTLDMHEISALVLAETVHARASALAPRKVKARRSGFSYVRMITDNTYPREGRTKR